MSVAELKGKLLEVIQSTEDQAVLRAMLDAGQLPLAEEPFTDEEIQVLEERRQKYLSGESKPIPWREVQARIKEKHGF